VATEGLRAVGKVPADEWVEPMMRSFVACAVLVCATSLATLVAPATARADDGRIHVVLVDGSEVQGELVEKVPGDHLTIQLATGEVRTIPWASIQSTNPVEPTPAPTTPPPPPPPPPTVMGPSAFGLGGAGAYGAFGNKNDIAWPKPDRTPSPWVGDHFYVGVASGIGTPTGYGGFVAAYDPAPYFELEVGIGVGGRFGYGVGGMARLELPLLKWMRMGMGLGFSENFLSSSDRAAGGPYPGAPAVSRWINFEFLEQSIAIGKTGFVRLSTGFAFVLNRSAYAAQCSDDAKNPSSKTFDEECFNHVLPVTPKRLGADARAPFVPYVGLEFLWRLS
jgi:hypothetical protein